MGIIGGGQLAKMLALAALQLGCEIVILERHEHSPAALLARSLLGDWDQPEALLKLGAQAEVVTLENEFVEAASLRAVEQAGFTLFPSAQTLALVQDKLVQKQTFDAAGLPTPRFRSVGNLEEAIGAANDFGWPLLLKARRNAYDGKGNATLRSAEEAPEAWERLGAPAGRELFVEEFCDFRAELAVMVTRGRDGECVTYPVVETIQRDHICHIVKAPASVPPEIAARAEDLARQAVMTVGGVGSFGVEMFFTRRGDLVLNEMAPRVHNSGHYTIEACVCSQFENHLRAVLGWPLGDPRMLAPAAAMVNLLGHHHSSGEPLGLERALAMPGAHVHIYGKTTSAPGRKMGHVTALGQSVEEALALAKAAADCLAFGIADT